MNQEQAIEFMKTEGKMLVDFHKRSLFYRWHPTLNIIQWRDSADPTDNWSEVIDLLMPDKFDKPS